MPTLREMLADAARRREARKAAPGLAQQPCHNCDSKVVYTPAERAAADARRSSNPQSAIGPFDFTQGRPEQGRTGGNRQSAISISVVIASLNEQDNLVATVASVKRDCPDAEIIVVDDGSTKPEPVAAIRNPRRLGGPRSRRLGALRATGDVVVFLDAHNALDWETANWFANRYPQIGAVRPEFKEFLDRPNKIRTLAESALFATKAQGHKERTSGLNETPFSVPSCLSGSAIVYGGCMCLCGRAGFSLVPEKGLYGGRWVRRRPDLPAVELWQTPAMMGAFYAVPRAVLDEFGGWPALPNYAGAQELAVALLAVAHRVPIYYHSGAALWHLFRGPKANHVPTPFTMPEGKCSQLGYAAAWRLVLDDAHWTDFRARLAAGQGPHGAIPEHVLKQCETEEFNRYRADAQSRFKLTSDELLAELDRLIAVNREERIQGAEDRSLNTGRKILLAVTFSADAGTSSNAATVAEKRAILGRCLESARAAGADKIAMFVVAPSGANPYALTGTLQAGIRVIRDEENPGLPLGETRLVRAAIEHAQHEGFEWIVKICGDVFHPNPGWAGEIVRRGMAEKAGAALVAGVCNNDCAVTKVFAARTDFLARTWPEEGEVAPQGQGAVLERIWTAKIGKLGLDKLWLKLPSRQAFEGKANWWTPTDPALAYDHTHRAEIAANWKMLQASG